MKLSNEEIKHKLIINAQSQKTFIFDLDGTIIYDGQNLEHRFEKVLLDIRSAGHQIIFATGRSERDFLPIMPTWCHDVPSILFGGGLVLEQQNIVYQQFLPSQDVNELIVSMEANDLNYLIDSHHSYYHPAKNHWLYDDVIRISGQLRDNNSENILRSGAYKVLILDDQWLSHYHDFITERNMIIKHHSYDKCFDIMPANVNKLTGLQRLELPDYENIYVFGNDGNDIEMIMNFPNSIMFGHHGELQKFAKLQIPYDEDLYDNFVSVINTILKK